MASQDPSPVLEAIRRALSGVPDPAALLESLFALAPFGLQIYAANGHSLAVNQAFLDLFGSQPPPEYSVLEDDIAEKTGILGLIRRSFAGETVRLPVTWYDPRELRTVHVERGNRVAIDTVFFPLRDRDDRVTHVGVMFKDVTAEQLAREQVERERDLLSAIVQQSGDGIVVVDREGIVQLVNPEARRQGAPAESQKMAMHDRVVLGPDGDPLREGELPVVRALRGEAGTTTIVVRGPDGVRRRLSTRATPLRGPDGTVRGAVITTRDETDRLRREEEAARTAHFREQFIAVLGHDLRSPLTAIVASANLILRNGDVPEAVMGAATRVASAGNRMHRMIADVLDFTQARLGGGIPVTPRDVDLGEVVEQVADEVSASHPDRVIERRQEGNVRGRFDADRIAQLVGNLLDNALAHGPPDEPVRIDLSGGREVRISVANRGPPVPPDERLRLFLPFQRGARAGARRGLGLGLFIVDQIARAHGGTVDVSSDESGTRFTVALPRQR